MTREQTQKEMTKTASKVIKNLALTCKKLRNDINFICCEAQTYFVENGMFQKDRWVCKMCTGVCTANHVDKKKCFAMLLNAALIFVHFVKNIRHLNGSH